MQIQNLQKPKILQTCQTGGSVYNLKKIKNWPPIFGPNFLDQLFLKQ